MFGKPDGSFYQTYPQDLAAEPITLFKKRNGFEGAEDIVYRCVTPVDK